MSRQIGIEDAYLEACQALGESIVMQRLLRNELDRLRAAAQEQPEEPAPGPPPGS